MVAAYALGAAAVLILSILLSISWTRTPFLGALFDRALVLTDAAPVGAHSAWDLRDLNSQQVYRLVAIDGSPVSTSAEVQAILDRRARGQAVAVTLEAGNGLSRTHDVVLGEFESPQQFAYIVLPEASALMLLLLGLWLILARRVEAAHWSVAILAISFSLVFASFFDQLSTNRLSTAWFIGIGIGAGAIFQLALRLPQPSGSGHRFRVPHWVGYGAGLVAGAIPFIDGLGSRTSFLFSLQPPYVLLIVTVLALVLVCAYRMMAERSPIERTRARIALATLALALGPLSFWVVLSLTGARSFTPYIALPAALLPPGLAYVVRGYNPAGVQSWLRQSVAHVVLSFLVVAAYALIIAGLTVLLETTLQTASPLWIAAIALIMAIAFEPARTGIQRLMDRLFFRGQHAVPHTIALLKSRLDRAFSLEAISRIAREISDRAIGPAAVHIFVFDRWNERFAAISDGSGAVHPSTEIRFRPDGALASRLAEGSLPLYLEEKNIPPALESERSRLMLLGARLFLPMQGPDGLAGWIALGPRLAGPPYSTDDVAFLQQWADAIAVAIARVRSVQTLERRVEELNALTRVSQGVNITLAFDDLLELVYAQTAQIVQLSHFHITLFNQAQNTRYLALAVENGERLRSRENRPLAPTMDLTLDIIRRGRPVITRDYAGQCQAAGVIPVAEGITAWMGVPLNAGAESIGVLGVGSAEAGAAYTQEQLDLIQAVADQTAGAIVKSRLLAETQHRSAQLGLLNDVARRLTSARDVSLIREAIVDGALEILECDGAVLYSIDRPGGELVVQAVSGQISKESIGARLSSADSNAARVAATGNPSIETAQSPHSNANLLEAHGTAFEPSASLAVPLRNQDSVIGVLEALNGHGTKQFVTEDEALAVALCGLAASALENVRLYAFTDQQLAARVEELSVMQRVDRELNATLETDRALRITLEWALRQSGAEAGMIGLLKEGLLQIGAEIGYELEGGGAAGQTLAVSVPAFQAAVETGAPQRVRFEVLGVGGFLPGADHQVVIPIRRESDVIGLLILESTRSSQEDLAFLARLSDHAAIAISNSQLYGEVQRANAAKSDFVSLVAHELKNPMTSIRGYTELLAAGAVGEVNEMQAGFLDTIRSNTERMSTLVSDLNDDSKIEAGRLRLEFKSLRVGEAVEEIARSTRRQFEEKHQTLVVELPDDLPPVWADPVRLAQVLTNLVSNATKYTPEGGNVRIGASATSNQWDPGGADRVIHVWVSDTGIGIAPEDQQRVFQKFFRSEDPKAREAPGAGLGLNITRSLVEMQGGRIWFESEYRRGTTFHFTVPVSEG